MSRSKVVVVALVLALSVFVALGLGKASSGNPINAIMEKLDLIVYLLEDNLPVERTGQTVSYYEGDDGDWQMGMPWPEERFTDNGDGTITDNWTSHYRCKHGTRSGAVIRTNRSRNRRRARAELVVAVDPVLELVGNRPQERTENKKDQ